MRRVVGAVVALMLFTGCGGPATEEGFAAAERACALVLQQRIPEAYNAALEATARDDTWGDLLWSTMIIRHAGATGDNRQVPKALKVLDEECAKTE